MRILQFLFVVFIFLVPFSVKAQLLQSNYLWPTNSGQFLSSTFGETRSAHFHAGLDIKTWGAEGYPVYATQDGYLSQLSISSHGYGKAIYLKHTDGSYSVYAHLSRFNNQFQKLADDLRFPGFSYEMNANFEKDSLYVRRGNIIGYTGSTGIGPPHLHFEIRNRDNEPINPLEAGFNIKDNVEPIFRNLLVEPILPTSTISGKNLAKTVSPKRLKAGSYSYGRVKVSGPVGLNVHVYDGANDVFNKYAIYELYVVQEADTLFGQKIDSFKFSQATTMPLDRIAAPGTVSKSYHRLYVHPNANHPFVTTYNEYFNVKYGVEYTIIAKDYFGNTSTATVQFEEDEDVVQKSDTIGLDELKNGIWFEDYISLEGKAYIDLNEINMGVLWDTTAGQRLVDFKNDPGTFMMRINPDSTIKVETPDRRIMYHYQNNTYHSPISVLHSSKIDTSEQVFEINIKSAHVILNKNIEVYAYLGNFLENYDKAALYHYNASNKRMSLVPSTISGNRLSARLPGFGTYRVVADTTKPVIKSIRYSKIHTGETVIIADVSDDLSGIDFRSAVFTVNGIQGIAEYDFEKNRFTYYNPAVKIQAGSSVYFKIKDRAGNFSEKEIRL